MDDFVTTSEALSLLNVKPASLYSYVSRGLIRRIRGKDSRGSLYSRSDIERQLARRGARKGHRATAGGALLWGDPVLESSISSITPEGPCYRGVPFQSLANGSGNRFERTAELLWTGHLPQGEVTWESVRKNLSPYLTIHEMAQRQLLSLINEPDGPTLDLSLRLARRAISLIATEGRGMRGDSIGEALARRCEVQGAAEAIDKALLVCAEHELNSSAFTARVAASTGAHLGQCLIAAVAAHSGPKHGGASSQLEALLVKLHSTAAMERHVASALTAGDPLPGFGHPLYPDGDPRATYLFSIAEEHEGNRGYEKVLKLCEIASKHGLKPNLDAGLVALSRVVGAPDDTAPLLFLVGRLAGWTAHALEQRSRAVILRPRARYEENGKAY